jgi:serine/threonine protein kinase
VEFDEYRLVEILGRGAMGVVYLARDTLLDRSVAIKFISGLGLSPQMIERFLNEARAAARIQHPNVVAVYRVGELQARPYLVSEFIRGKSLEQEAIPIAWDRARDLAYGLASGLAAAHRCGVLHRDIKPANAIVASDGQVKLVDFGLAKLNDEIPDRLSAFERISQPVAAPAIRAEALLLRSSGDVTVPVDLASTPGTGGRSKRKSDGSHLRAVRSTFAESPEASVASEWRAYVRKSSSAATWPSLHEVSEARPTGAVSMTRAGQIVGTPLFLAPELWAGLPATTQSDVYALGALVYELCAGTPPHDADDLDALSALVRSKPIEPILLRAPAIDVGFAGVIMRCLAQDPAERFRDGEAVREALEKLRPRAEILLPPEGNPYRGLSTFEAEHRALFFGRGTECGAVLERLRQGQLVLVAGDSGVGKSSLCRAAVLPLVAEGALAEGRAWTSHVLSPGRRPLLALAGAIAAEIPGTTDEELLQRVLDGGPGAAAADLRKALGDKRGVVLFVDQLEELVTIADGEEAQVAADLLAALSRAGRGVRVLATVRGDLLTRLASLGALADAMMSALSLRPSPGSATLRARRGRL